MIIDLINNILPSFEHLRIFGYWIAFLAALLETTIGLGLFFPGSTIILLLGAISARGSLDVGDLIWFAIFGAIIGDNINYFLGKKYGAKWLKDGFWLIKAIYIEKAKNFFDVHGARSIFLGRFIPSLKEVVPFIAGSVGMNQRTFMFWNILGAAGWGIEWVLAGYIFAQSLNLAEVWLSRAGLLFAFILLIALILYFLKWLFVRNGKQFLIVSASLYKSIREAVTTNEHVIKYRQKYPRIISILKARLAPTTFSGRPLTIFVLAFGYIFALFAGIVEDLITSDPIVQADIRISHLISIFRTEVLTEIFTWITLLGKSHVIILFIIISAILLWLWRKKYCILSLLIAVAGSEGFTYLGKLVFQRPRPETAVYVEHSFSFPSGHATIAVSFYGFAAYLLIRAVQSWNKKVNIFFIAILLILLIGISRVYLGEHYISDVWSGYLVGAMWLVMAISISEWRKSKENQPILPVPGARPISFLLIGFAILFYTGFSMSYHPPIAATPPTKVAVVSNSSDIFINAHMKFTETLIGEKQEPINIIFIAKDKKDLIGMLQKAGWELNNKADISASINLIKNAIFQTDHLPLPISPSFWNAKIQDMSFFKVLEQNHLKNALHIKIWGTYSALKNGKFIYVGMVNGNDGFKWGIMPKIAPDIDIAREILFSDLIQTGKINHHSKIQLVEPLIGKNFTGDQFFTDGNAYIISVQ